MPWPLTLICYVKPLCIFVVFVWQILHKKYLNVAENTKHFYIVTLVFEIIRNSKLVEKIKKRKI